MNGRLHLELVMDLTSFRSCTTALPTPLHPSNVYERSFQGYFGRVRGRLPR